MSYNRNQLDDLVDINYTITKEHSFFKNPTGLVTQLLLVGSEIDEALQSLDIDCDPIIDDLREGIQETMENLEEYRRVAENVDNDNSTVSDVDNFEEEMADIFIRMFSLVGYIQKDKGLDTDIIGRVFEKMHKNMDRPYKHNKNF